MQEYDSLALEDNLEIGVVARPNIFLGILYLVNLLLYDRLKYDLIKEKSELGCWTDAFAPVPSSSQPKKQTHSLQWGLLREDLVIFPTYQGPIVNGPGMVLG